MLFNLFSSRTPNPASSKEQLAFDPQGIDAERAALSAALYSLLENLPQSYSGRENINLLCHAILGASAHLRFAWIGFCEVNSDSVEPYAALGDCAQECEDWQLPATAFDPSGPYSQTRPDASGAEDELKPLFMPWRENRNACSVQCALAIPLRSEKGGLRGMIVFYADSIDYFAHLGAPLFQAFGHVAEIIWKQSNLRHLLTAQAHTDPLTGLMNRRYTMQVLEQELLAAEQEQEPLSILICRVEGFNRLNDLYGWLAADGILAVFTKDAVSQMRPDDKGGRWTGIEFMYILPRTNAEQAAAVAQKLQDYFMAHPINVKNWSIRLALLVGVATYTKLTNGIDDLIQHATQDMLCTKNELPASITL